MNNRSSLLISFFLLGLSAMAQFPMRVNSNLSADFLVRKILVEEGSDISISNIAYKGSPESIGGFSNTSKYYIIKKGIVLSTGLAESALGPNQYNDMGTAMGTEGNEWLDEISSGKTYDASELSFEFASSGDSIKFNFIFASEEYPEYVHKGVNDIFAFFIEDLENGERRNLAVFGRPAKAVNVDNINAVRNSELYIENGIWDPNNVLQWKDNPGLGELAMTYEFDGFTTRLTAGSSIVPGRKYRITFVIADVGDRIYDSAVFLEYASFKSLNSVGKDLANGELLIELNREFDEASVSISEDEEHILIRLMVHFDFDDDGIKADSSLLVMEKLSRFLRLHDDLKIIVKGHTDSFGEEAYNMSLSERRANSASEMLLSSGIEPSRITTEGYGATDPIADNITEQSRLKNRRIEFELRK